MRTYTAKVRNVRKVRRVREIWKVRKVTKVIANECQESHAAQHTNNYIVTEHCRITVCSASATCTYLSAARPWAMGIQPAVNPPRRGDPAQKGRPVPRQPIRGDLYRATKSSPQCLKATFNYQQWKETN